MRTSILGIGSNIGDRKAHIKKAIKKLNAHSYIDVERVSSLIETEAMSRLPQPKFLNGVLMIKTI